MLHVQSPAHGLLELLPELLPLESSSATHSHWPAQVGLLDDELTDDDGELGTLDALGGTLDGGGEVDDGELGGGLLDGEDEETLELLLDPQLHTSTQDVPAADTLQSWPS